MKVQNYKKYLMLFCVTGFLAGILYANMGTRDYIAAMGIFDKYTLNQYAQTELLVQEYFWYLLPIRMVPFLCMILLGQLRIRRVAVAGFLVWTGFLSGMLVTSAIMKLGIKGVLFCMAAIFPQGIFYVTGYGILLWYLYLYPQMRWNLTRTIGVLVTMGVGILLECYANPFFLKMFIKTI